VREISDAVLKAHCLTVLDDVQATGEPVLVTKRGIPLVKLVPVKTGQDDLFGFMAGEFKIVGEIESPVVPPKQWNAPKK
jgi:prevent-host-death family protein